MVARAGGLEFSGSNGLPVVKYQGTHWPAMIQWLRGGFRKIGTGGEMMARRLWIRIRKAGLIHQRIWPQPIIISAFQRSSVQQVDWIWNRRCSVLPTFIPIAYSMDTAVIPSTFFLTLLLSIGLFFFIRASTKDRTEVAKLTTEVSEDLFLPQLKTYFEQRAYRVVATDPSQQQVTLTGVVRPSWFLAIFLTLLAGLGILCLGLVLSMIVPQWTAVWLGLVVVAPAAGLFYWQRAGRSEQVSFRVETNTASNGETQTVLMVTAHRDEVAELQRSLNLKAVE